MKSLLAFSFIFCLSCTSATKRFILSEEEQEKYTVYFNRQKIKALKKEWRELYDFAANGHILKSKDSDTFFTSYEFHHYITAKHGSMLFSPFFQDYNNVIAFFGEPTYTQEYKGVTSIIYHPVPLDDPCETCTNSGFSFEFNSETMTSLFEKKKEQ